MKKLTNDEHLLELFDKRFKNVTSKPGTKGAWSYEFTLEPGDSVNPNEIPITYRVNFSSHGTGTYPTKLGASIRTVNSTLTFSNNLTGMSTLADRGYQNVNEALVFSTISAIVIDYFTRVKSTQSISFTAAHAGLHKAYKILAKEAEKKGPLIWVNPVPNPSQYCIARKDVFEEFEQRLAAFRAAQ